MFNIQFKKGGYLEGQVVQSSSFGLTLWTLLASNTKKRSDLTLKHGGSSRICLNNRSSLRGFYCHTWSGPAILGNYELKGPSWQFEIAFRCSPVRNVTQRH